MFYWVISTDFQKVIVETMLKVSGKKNETYKLLKCNIWNLRCGVVLGEKICLLATCRNWKGYVNTSKVNEKWNRWKP